MKALNQDKQLFELGECNMLGYLCEDINPTCLSIFSEFLYKHNQPERSKREDLHHKDCIPWLKHNCSHCYETRFWCDHGKDCDSIIGVRMRCSEHCGDTVREAQ
jgi:hypothetical protein